MTRIEIPMNLRNFRKDGSGRRENRGNYDIMRVLRQSHKYEMRSIDGHLFFIDTGNPLLLYFPIWVEQSILTCYFKQLKYEDDDREYIFTKMGVSYTMTIIQHLKIEEAREIIFEQY